MNNSAVAMFRRYPGVLGICLLVLAGAGCATFKSYQVDLTRTLDLVAIGEIDGALDAQERSDVESRDLLYFLERGELLRLAGRYEESQQAWLAADTRVHEWEEVARLSPDMLLRDAASLLVNDKARVYGGQDFEKVMLTTRMAQNHLALGQWDLARVAIKRTHEREALIAQLRSKQVRRSEEDAEKEGYARDFRELEGYPVETIDSPEVNELRNSYQSAFSHYLAGFVYEALGERGLAAAGYRQAVELRPGIGLLEEGLAGLDKRFSQRGDAGTDLLIVIESGMAPARTSVNINIPVATDEGLMVAPISFPVLRSDNGFAAIPRVEFDDQQQETAVDISSVDLMSRRALKDEMPWIILRAAARATAKVALQKAAAREDEKDGARAAAIIGAIITEHADERGWRSLPAEIAIVRTRLAPGPHEIVVDAGSQPHRFDVAYDDPFAVISVRLFGGKAYVALPPGREDSESAAIGVDSRDLEMSVNAN